MKLDERQTTPMARKKIGPAERLLIATAEPLEALAAFGYSNGWTCRIRLDGKEIGASFHMFTIRGALAEAVKDMHAREVAA